MANTSGGDFVLGVIARDGIAEAVPGLATVNVDADKLKLEQWLANGLEPRLPSVDVQAVACPNGCSTLIVRVGRSWIGPHRVKANSKFYGRNSGGKYQLDVSELRMAFVMSETIGDRIRKFRSTRMSEIMSGDLPLQGRPNGAVVLHMVPFSSYADRHMVDVVPDLISSGNVALPLNGNVRMVRRSVNLEGILCANVDESGMLRSYAQTYRSGAIEAAYWLSTDDRSHRPFVAGVALANMLADAVKQYLGVLERLQVGLPIFALLSMAGVFGSTLRYRIEASSAGFHVTEPFRRDVMLLPEGIIESWDANVGQALKSMLHTLWNAYGLIKPEVYSDGGEWLGVGGLR